MTNVPDAVAPYATTAADRGRRTLRVLLLVACQSSQSVMFSALALFLPLIRDDLGLTFTQAGLIPAVGSLTYALMQIPTGVAADRHSPRLFFMIGVLGTNVLAFTLARLHQLDHVLINQAAAGVFRALIFAPGLLLVTALFTERRRATALGLYAAGGFGANVLLNLIGPQLVRTTGWRGLFDDIAIAGMILLAFYWIFSGRGHGRDAKAPMVGTTGQHFRDPRFWLVASIQFIRLAVAVGITFWLPAFLVIDRGLSLEVVGPVIAIGAVATAVSNFVGGYLSDRSRRPRLVIGLSLGALAATISGIAVVQSVPLLLGIVAVNAFFIQLYFGPLFALPVTLFGSRTAGVTTGAGNLTANLGGLVSVFALGALRDATGSFTPGFAALSALCVIGLLFTWLIGKDTRASTLAP